MAILASICYAISIFIDVFVYHLKLNIHDKNNIRYLFSLFNIFQYSARGFIMIFVPIMAYYTETLKDKETVWLITVFAHCTIILFLIPLFSDRFSFTLSIKTIKILNLIGRRNIKIEIKTQNLTLKHFQWLRNIKLNRNFLLMFISTYISGILFSISISFLYYLTFSYPENILTIVSYSQILNMFGSFIMVLFIDPKIMSYIDNGEGLEEVKILTFSRVIIHLCLVLFLFYLK